MSEIELVIKIPENTYRQIQALARSGYFEHDICGNSMRRIANGTPLPKGHGRLIDADAFIKTMEDASKRHKYKGVLINNCLTVDDVFKAVIESLQNEGLANGDSPTIIEADKE